MEGSRRNMEGMGDVVMVSGKALMLLSLCVCLFIASMYLDVMDLNTVKVNTEEVNVWRKKLKKKKVKI